MRTVVGISLLILGSIAVVIGNFQHMLAEVELLEKRPDLANSIYGKWLSRPSPWKVEKFYKS
ncbi:MAG TPA: hypothetical protein VJA94_23815, partial [Candidatus Angelobacter sp.]